MSIDEITNWKDQLELLVKGLDDSQKDQLLKILQRDKQERSRKGYNESLLNSLWSENISKNRITNPIATYRERWEKEMGLNDETKNKIINAVGEMQGRIYALSDWGREARFKLWNEEYVIGDPINFGKHIGIQTIGQAQFEMLELLWKLWKQVGLSDEEDQMAMLEYLIWRDRQPRFRIFHDDRYNRE